MSCETKNKLIMKQSNDQNLDDQNISSVLTKTLYSFNPIVVFLIRGSKKILCKKNLGKWPDKNLSFCFAYFVFLKYSAF